MKLFFDRFIRACKKPNLIPIAILHRHCHHFSDEWYLSHLFKLEMGYPLNLKRPQTFNEKLNWLKLYDRNPLYTRMADKYEAKLIVSNIIGAKYVVPCYGVWDSFDDINFETLPNRFVIKGTNDSSGVFICKNKEDLNKDALRNNLLLCQKRNYYYSLREWVYKDIKPRIIIDQFLDDQSGHELMDYKFMCFNGIPRVMYQTNKASNIYENFYDMDYNVLNINHGFKRHIPEFEKPAEFDLMKELAAKLSAGIPFVRVDFFDVAGRVYFGEFTFYDWGGMRPFSDVKWDKILGNFLVLPKNNEE